jgi:hypothetical protein
MNRDKPCQPLSLFAAAVSALFTMVAGTALAPGCTYDDEVGSITSASRASNTDTYNLHLQELVRFKPIEPGADAVAGRELFGVAADLLTEDKSLALFEGLSQAFGGVVVSNQRTCFTCHRGSNVGFGLPPPPLSASIPATDALFTGIQADAQGDPDAAHNLDALGLIKYRPNRFNLIRPATDSFRRVFFWRKSPRLTNVGLTNGLLLDARARNIFEADRGAIFSHTQSSDLRFDDLFQVEDGNDLEAFQFSLLSDPMLAALRDPAHPMHDTLVEDPFYTVPITSPAERQGQRVFIQYCMGCHDTPNVFNNVSNIEASGSGARPVAFPPFPPSLARTFDIGVSQSNRHHLRFTHDEGNGTFSAIVIPLVKNDGTMVQHTVSFDIGLAATTARWEDLGRFKVPQLRAIKDAGPYFHDNSAATLEEVVDYFNSDAYNESKDGRRFPIHLSTGERAALLSFLKIL